MLYTLHVQPARRSLRQPKCVRVCVHNSIMVVFGDEKHKLSLLRNKLEISLTTLEIQVFRVAYTGFKSFITAVFAVVSVFTYPLTSLIITDDRSEAALQRNRKYANACCFVLEI